MATPNSPALALNRWQRLAIHCALLVLCLPAILPVLWMVSTALKSDSEVLNSAGVSLSSLIPKSAHWSNFPDALRFVPFGVYLRNTLTLCAITVLGVVVSSAVVAYGFARIRFKGSGFWFATMIATMALPGQVTMIPVFALFRWLGWYGSYLPLTVPSFCGSAFYIFLLTQFFKTVPEELAESARLDGAQEWTVFTRIVLPLAKPALATCALFQFLGTWNDFMGPLLYINDPNKYTLAYGLQQFYSSYGSKWGLLMAAATVFTLPIVLLFFLAQRTFVQGISTTGGRN
ncbi:carbohydrate ABC transporter permease [Fimbriimonas ginsengisoli]|uniref:Sugar ABC transporter permease n=1 Tax=Fimbriimonas ginsengisoli Gsoil 348 TaxID=661478 RepID=A0A068NY30_FIMGI|nr:carbohydrate ABC transporter permease [Fimbriimonas ginsengisoli]AIE87795.1 sugar ABC transporter permease [Fimbriimonas ginsengisoli Gsoil 348]